MGFLIGLVLGMTIGVLVMGAIKSGQMGDVLALNDYLRREISRLAGGKG